MYVENWENAQNVLLIRSKCSKKLGDDVLRAMVLTLLCAPGSSRAFFKTQIYGFPSPEFLGQWV